MACRGAHLGLTAEQVKHALTLGGGDALIEYLEELCEKAVDFRESTGEVYWQETDKAWEAIHRCLAEIPPPPPPAPGEEPDYWDLPADAATRGPYPLKLAILGGRDIYAADSDEPDYFVHLVEPHEVKDLAAALAPIRREWMRAKYLHHCDGAYPEFGDEDFEYTWGWFEALREFYIRMAAEGRTVIFLVDQ
jgi:hypothetical protein